MVGVRFGVAWVRFAWCFEAIGEVRFTAIGGHWAPLGGFDD